MHLIVNMLFMISSFFMFQSNAEGGPENEMSLGDGSQAPSYGTFEAMNTKTHENSTLMILCIFANFVALANDWFCVYKRVTEFWKSGWGLSAEQENSLQIRTEWLRTSKIDALEASLNQNNDDSSRNVVANGTPTHIHKVTGEALDANAVTPAELQKVFQVYSVESETRVREGITAINDEIRRFEDEVRSRDRFWNTVWGVPKAILTPGTILINVSLILSIAGEFMML